MSDDLWGKPAAKPLSTNPFAPGAFAPKLPEAFERPPLASLGKRFAGFVVDWGITLLVLSPVMAVGAVDTDYRGEPPEWAVGLFGGYFVLAMLGLTAVHWYLITTQGQSPGKMLVGSRIVKQDGSPVDFVSGVLVRNIAFAFVIGVANQFCIGWALSLANALFIFGEDRRCVHDRMAGTIVVDA